MGKSRPKGKGPKGRRGRGGVGPGPAYRPNPNTGGTRHTTGGCMLAKAVGGMVLVYLAAAFAAVVAGVLA